MGNASTDMVTSIDNEDSLMLMLEAPDSYAISFNKESTKITIINIP